MGRPVRYRRRALPAVASILLATAPAAAHAGRYDLNLLNLCPQHTPARATLGAMVPECRWIKRQPGTGLIEGVAFDDQTEGRFRSLMSELGVVLAPRLLVPAETLGYAGFQVSGEVGMTTISADQPYWDGVESVSPANPSQRRPDGWLTTVGMFVRKGLWLPLPAVELGGGVMHLLDSQLLSWQGYAKLGIHEGFHDWPLPSLAVRGSLGYVTGTDQVRLHLTSLDVILSKTLGVARTSRLEPFAGWSFLLIHVRGQRLDATPSCDAHLVRTAGAEVPLGDYCAEAQRGTPNDALANFVFPEQDAIVRHRFFGGAKLKFATVFLSAQYEITPAGRTRDTRKPNGARDGSNKQESVSLSGGFDF
jgi:hypothetical protein